MAKNDNAHSLRLTEQIARVAGTEEAQRFTQAYPLSKSASIEKKYDWACAACAYLEDRFGESAIRDIRGNCRCNDGKSIAAKLLRYANKTGSIREFVELFNQHETFASLEYISDRCLLFCYPECYCACVKRVPGPISRTWCLCTLGNAEGIFTQVFGERVCVTLVESIKTGGERCAIRVEWS